PGRVVDAGGREVGRVGAVELVTVGQRRGLGALGGRKYALDVDVAARTVMVGGAEELLVGGVHIREMSWVGAPADAGADVSVQVSAHGQAHPGRWKGEGSVRFDAPVRRVAPGQAVVLYEGERVLGGGMASGASG
ncbi:MAG: aminomethyltransferase beta-barrel domain-containing protein, partial [Acidimicrobiales bacterium]